MDHIRIRKIEEEKEKAERERGKKKEHSNQRSGVERKEAVNKQ